MFTLGLDGDRMTLSHKLRGTFSDEKHSGPLILGFVFSRSLDLFSAGLWGVDPVDKWLLLEDAAMSMTVKLKGRRVKTISTRPW